MSNMINTNISSLNAQNNLAKSQSSLATSLQRLSTGLRINSAKDDAAGMAISERMTSQIRGLNQASRNANDGISMTQTADSALGEVTNNLQRIRELAVQSTNSTNSTADRAAIDLEVQQRIDEIDRSASQTSFNGQKILDGKFGNASFQIGANVGETISMKLDSSTSVRAADIGTLATSTATVDVNALFVDANDDPQSVTIATGSTAALMIQTGSADAVEISGTFETADDLLNAINSSGAGVLASIDSSTGIMSMTSSKDITVTGTGGTTLGFATTAAVASGGISDGDVKTAAGANTMIQRIDQALESVSTLRSTFGAVQNRFDSVISSLASTTENTASARSRIQDADFAVETAALTRGQILQQAGTAMLAQANSLPNGVMALLR